MKKTLVNILPVKLSEKARLSLVKLISYLFVLLFFYAAANKLLDYQKFVVQIGQSPILTPYASLIAWLIPGAELLIAIALVFNRTLLAALYASLSIMMMFTAYIVIILNLAERIPCNCGGILGKLQWHEHLVFNIFFVLLAWWAIVAYTKLQVEAGTTETKTYTKPTSFRFGQRTSGNITLIAALSTVPILLFYGAYYLKLERNSYDFKRNFVTPIRGMHRLDIKFTNFYFAGKVKDSIYLGNYAATGRLIKTDTLLSTYGRWAIKMDTSDFVNNRGQYTIHLDGGNFYMFNGAAKSVVKGELSNWKAKPFAISAPYFQEAVSVSPQSMVFRYVSSKTNTNSLRKESLTGSSIENDTVMKKQVDGLFCTSGMLRYASDSQKLIYTYYYRNEVLILDTNLNLIKRMKTIDPIDSARFKTASIKSDQTTVSVSPTLLVNGKSAVWRNYLFIQSALMGKNEDDVTFKKSAVVDVYDLEKYSYVYSFYLPDQDKVAIKSFAVYDGDIYTLSDHYINKFKLILPKRP